MQLPSYNQEAMTGSDHFPVFTMDRRDRDWTLTGKGLNKQSVKIPVAKLMYKIPAYGGGIIFKWNMEN